MSVLPPAPWVIQTRKVILWIGFGWPIAVFLMALGEKKSGRLGINRRYVFVSNFYSAFARVVAYIANVQKPNYRGTGSACYCLLVGRQSIEHL